MDRTLEFRSCVNAVSRLNSPISASRNNLSANDKNGNVVKQGRGTFSKQAASIAHDINNTMEKLERLSALARRKTLFDDKSVEISELTYVIKQDLARINMSIAELQKYAKSNSGKSNSQRSEHAEKVVVLLQGKLTSVTSGFKGVLEVRTKNIQASRSRTEQFMNINSHSDVDSRLSSKPGSGFSTPDQAENPYAGSSDVLTLPNQQQSLSLLEQQQDQYIQERGSAIEAIESTIQELGGIFQQLAHMVSEQRDMVQRIDQDTEAVLDNVSGAHRELLKYYATISSNRWLFLRVFGILLIFFLLWVVVT
ncbi:hypothetical protein CANCADRAFT_57091 [Tortispora caseinolytica NRRL Y-17796]|uniref:t-SNARE coiled-coil homology domain-containing protein n=1 Tax=Tortispora caseinolytica NRRL Y-17796 TaxID=767744 RepID=A0A1E4TFZ4_9ASCO|nr:hypothetical protein CANCADRAFT_57091 [Tortispora caseinolytica NRRL Y-17796]